MADWAGLAVHQPAAHDLAAKMLANGLVPKANAEKWLLCLCTGRDHIEANTCFIGCAWTGGEQESLRTAR